MQPDAAGAVGGAVSFSTKTRWRGWLALLLAGTLAARAEVPALLKDAVDRWLGEKDYWAFKQHVIEYDGDRVEQDRWERYDPSHPDSSRWTLLSIDGRKATAEEWDAWNKRKNKKRRKDSKPLADYFDMEKAQVAAEDARIIRYAVPLQGTANWLFPIDKVQLSLTVNKKSKAIERADAKISEPFKVALGLARILDFHLDVQMLPAAEAGDPSANPAEAKPDGEIRAVVNKLGQRVEYVWSDFERVTPNAERLAAK